MDSLSRLTLIRVFRNTVIFGQGVLDFLILHGKI